MRRHAVSVTDVFFYLAMCDFRRYYMAVFGTNGKRKGLREKGKFEYDTCIKRVSVIRRFCMSGWSASHSAPGAQLEEGGAPLLLRTCFYIEAQHILHFD